MNYTVEDLGSDRLDLDNLNDNDRIQLYNAIYRAQKLIEKPGPRSPLKALNDTY